MALDILVVILLYLCLKLVSPYDNFCLVSFLTTRDIGTCKGYDVTVIDNLVNSSEESINRVRRITGCAEHRIKFIKVDMCDRSALERVFELSPPFLACIHFAGLKAVGESVRLPLLYYENNLLSTINLLNLMDKYACRTIVFSSSATVRITHLMLCFDRTNY